MLFRSLLPLELLFLEQRRLLLVKLLVRLLFLLRFVLVLQPAQFFFVLLVKPVHDDGLASERVTGPNPLNCPTSARDGRDAETAG